MASVDSPSQTPTRCLPRNAARTSCGSSSQDEDRFGLKNDCYSSNENLRMMEIVDNPQGVTADIAEEDCENNVSLVGVHPYHTLEPDYGPPGYYDPHHNHHHLGHTLPVHQGGQSADHIIQAVDDYLRNEHLTPESGNHSNRSSASLSDPGSTGNPGDMRDGQIRQEPIHMSTLPSLPVIPETHRHRHNGHAHSCSSLYHPTGTLGSNASGYLRVDGSVGSCRSPIYETVSSNEVSIGCSSCAQLRSLGSSTYRPPTRGYNHPASATLADSAALHSMDNLRMHERLHEGCPSTPTTVPVFRFDDIDRHASRSQVVYPHMSKDDLKDRPSWRCLAVGFLIFALLLFAVIAFLTVLIMTRTPVSMESFNPPKPSYSGPSEGKRPLVTDPGKGFDATVRPNTLGASGGSGPLSPIFIGPGAAANKTIPPGEFWYLYFESSDLQVISYNLTVDKHSNLVVYGRQGRLPSHSRFDFVQTYTPNGHRSARDLQGEEEPSLDNGSKRRVARASEGGQRTWAFTEEFVEGEWFLGVFNDGDSPERIRIASLDNAEWSCPNRCSNNGYCNKGQCVCNPAFSGVDCSEGLCPVLCNSRGDYVHGECVCQAGWKGPECSIAWDECLTPDCSGHGMCAQGECLCDSGYTGEDCSQEAVLERTICGNHTDCVANAECVDGICQCADGWTGASCEQQTCVSSCSPHGECINSRCVCDRGWNGKFCRLDGCPQGCSGHGDCQSLEGIWQCVCERGYQGDGCQVTMELACNDGQDNDADNLIDCSDPDCCVSDACSGHSLCQTLPDPSSVMTYALPSQPFFEHYRSWLDRQGTQIQALFHTLEEQSRASIVRGRVITRDGTPIPVVKVWSSRQPGCGHTFTRSDGWFDLLVVGGQPIKLEFQRSGLVFHPTSVFVPMNTIIVADDIDGSDQETEECMEDCRQPPEFAIIAQRPQPETPLSDTGIILDHQGIHEEIQLRPSKTSLHYFSHLASGAATFINISIAEHTGLHRVQLIHIQVDIAGIRRSKVVEPEPNLSVIFDWDKRNVYGKPVYGKTRAKVSVGYEYYSCSNIAWSVQAVSLEGVDWSTTNMGDWLFPMHHTYNPSAGVLLMGDGTRIDYGARPPHIHTIMGNGRPRTASCPQCDGKARNSRLLAPTAIVTALDGSVYVGDAELIMRIDPEGNSSVLFHFTYVPTYKYYMAMNTVENKLYLAEPQTRIIYQILIPANGSNQTTVETFAGTGQVCSLVEPDGCGDNGPAINAKLHSPKGVAVSKEGKVYFIDGNTIRVIDTDGIISSFLGIPGTTMPFRRLRCGTHTPINKLTLQYPTELAISPLDEALYVVDDNVILRITLDGMASVFAGIPSGCLYSSVNLQHQSDTRRADEDVLESPTAIAFSSTGDLFVAETDYSRTHRVRAVSPEGYISTVVGGITPCDCQLEECGCFAGDEGSVTNALIQSPIALTLSYNDDLIFIDQGNLRIRKLVKQYPRLHRRRYVYEIPSPYKNDILLFNQFGFHFKTKHILLDEAVYIFNYTDTHDSLIGIQDSSGFAISILRNSAREPLAMEIGKNGTLVPLQVDENGLLVNIERLPEVGTVQMEYEGGLLVRKLEKGSLTNVYGYNGLGNLAEALWPTGDIADLSSVVNKSASITTCDAPDRTETKNLVIKSGDRWEETISQGDLSESAYLYNNGTCQMNFTDGTVVTMTTEPSPLLDRVFAEVYNTRSIQIPNSSAQTAKWEYTVQSGGRNRDKILLVTRKLKVNGKSILSLSYNRFTDEESLYNPDGNLLLTVSHDAREQIRAWMPNNDWQETRMGYDNQGRLNLWQRNLLYETYHYNENGRVEEIRLGNNSRWRFDYHQSGQPARVTPPGNDYYSFSYTSDGELGSIVMPGRETHFLSSQTTLGLNRRSYSFQGSDPWLIQDTLHTGHPSTTLYPGTGRRVSKQYDSRGRLATVLYDRSVINLSYHGSSGQLKLVELQEGDFQNTIRVKSSGPIMKNQRVDNSGFDEFMCANFEYKVNGNLQNISISATFNWTLLSSHNKVYDQHFGRLISINGLNIAYPDMSSHVLSDSVFTMHYTMGDYFLLRSISYSILGRSVLTLSFVYNFEISVYHMNVWSNNRALQFNYTYNNRGFLSEVNLNDTDDPLLYRYVYSSNGNLIAIDNHRERKAITLHYDHRDCVTMVGDVEYKHDADGILSQRGEAMFEYNSRGLLVHAYEPRAYDVRYKYDGLGRRIWKKDHTGKQVQFFYADPNDKWAITHIYNKKTSELWTLDYDLRGSLVSIRQNLRRWYVVTDHLGSILQVWSPEGEEKKTLIYDPWGNILEDSDPALDIYLGYRGGLQDPHTKLVHFRGRDYDPISRRWTSPDVSFYEDLGQTRKLRKFNLYTFHGNTPMNRELEPPYMTDMDSWFSIFGYNMDALLPSISPEGHLTDFSWSEGDITTWKKESGSIISQVKQNINSIRDQLHILPSVHLSRHPFAKQKLSLKQMPLLLGNGIEVSMPRGRIMTRVSSPYVSGLELGLATVINGSLVGRQWQNYRKGKDFQYFFKTEIKKLSKDLEMFGMSQNGSSNSVASIDTNVTLQQFKNPKAYAKLTVSNSASVWSIFYGLDGREVSDIILEEAKRWAVEQAWARERWELSNGRRGSIHWTDPQIDAILETGSLEDFEGVYSLDPREHPAVAFDGNNIKIRPVQKSTDAGRR